jgi:serine/threonine protein kinase
VSHTSELATSALELAKTAGTPAFFAPELCWTTETQDRPSITKAIDVWALGVTLFCLLCGRVPFEAHNEFELFDKITTEEVEIPPTLDDEAADLLKRMLIKDPVDRITISEIKHHPFVLKGVKNPEQWISDTNPGLFGQLEVDDQEVYEAVSSYETFKRRLSKITNKLAGGLRRRTISSEDKTPRAFRRAPAVSESSSKSSSWMNFMRTSDSGDGGAASSTTSRGDPKDIYSRPFDTRIKSEEQLHPGARPILARRNSPREVTNLTRSHSPSFKKQPVVLGDATGIDVPTSHLTRSIGFHQGLIVEEEDDEGPRLPSLSFESVDSDCTTTSPHDDDEDDDDDGLLIDFNKRRTPYK